MTTTPYTIEAGTRGVYYGATGTGPARPFTVTRTVVDPTTFSSVPVEFDGHTGHEYRVAYANIDLGPTL